MSISAGIDTLTGLPSRSSFVRYLERTIARDRGPGTVLAVLSIDVAGIDDINMTVGHDGGDEALQEVARRLCELLSSSDTVLARFAGTQFVVLREGVASELEALRIAEDALRVIRLPLIIGEQQVLLTGSVGIATVHHGHTRAADVLRDAEGALRHAKALGGNRTEVFTVAARERVAERLRIEEELRLALVREELILHFQPIMSLRQPGVPEFEALVRWRHPSRGMLPPSRFVPIAEESDLIIELGDWVIADVCRRVARWTIQDPELALPRVSINVSQRQLMSRAFVSRVAAALLATDVAPSSITFEITESSVMDTCGETIATLDALKLLGVKVVLDDFGTGYSSLAHLADLPIDSVKIDRGFVRGVHRVNDPVPIVDAVVGIGQALGLTVVAEGIETEAQLEAVRSAGVDAVQGFCIARPAPIPSAPALRELQQVGLARVQPARNPAPTERNAADDEWVTLSAAAVALDVSSSTVRRLADEGRLPSSRTPGGHRRFRRIDLQRFARQQRGIVRLRPVEMPAVPLAEVVEVLSERGTSLVEHGARATYEAWRPGWFATARARMRSRHWLDAVCAALAAGASRDAARATADYLLTGVLAGATMAECMRFLDQFAHASVAELIRTRASKDEIRDFRRLMAACSETFLERLDG